MAKKKPTKPPLTDEELATLKAIAERLVQIDRANEEARDFDAHEALLNQLYYGIGAETSEKLLELLTDANDADCRSPK